MHRCRLPSAFFFLSSLFLSHPLHFSYVVLFCPRLLDFFQFPFPLFVSASLFILLCTFSPHFLHRTREGWVADINSTLCASSENMQIQSVIHGNISIEEVESAVTELCCEKEITETEVKRISLPCKEYSSASRGKSIDNGNGAELIEESEAAAEFDGEKIWCEKETIQEEPKIQNFSTRIPIEENSETISSLKFPEDRSVWNSPDYSFEHYSSRRVYSPSCSNFGSMRVERDWRRTLACKLLEDRHTMKGEGMDLLWEAYETESCKPVIERIYNDAKNCGDSYSGSLSEFSYKDDDREEKLCCLRAMKLSTGKMSMRMGGNKLSKISRALKEAKWIHSKRNNHH